MTQIDVRMYHVGFGDCFLLTIHGARQHRVLIDCGVHSGSKKPDPSKGEPTFREVVARMLADVKGTATAPSFDVIVASHRHRDHVYGFSFDELWKDVQVKEVWLPWVENDRDPIANEVRDAQEEMARRANYALRALRKARRGPAPSREREVIDIAYNNTANEDAMRQLRNFPGAKVRYLPRSGFRPDLLDDEIDAVLPAGVKVHVLAPSHDPRVIRNLDPPREQAFGSFAPPMAAPKLAADDDDADGDGDVADVPRPCDAGWHSEVDAYGLTAEEQVALGRLGDAACAEAFELTYRVDKAVNGTSLVLVFEIGDVKLLFPGDAQWGSWEVMLSDDETKSLLAQTSVYKVGHHGSHNATPRSFVEAILADRRLKAAMVPVATTKYEGGWQRIPESSLIDALRARSDALLVSNEPPRDRLAHVTVDEHWYTEYTVLAND